MKEFFRILKYSRPYVFRLIFGFLLILLIAQSALFMPLVQKFVIDDILLPTETSEIRTTFLQSELRRSFFGVEIALTPFGWLTAVLCTVILFHLILGLISYLRTYVMTWVSQRILFDMRNQAFAHLQSMSMRFYDTQGTGQIMSRLTGDINSLNALVTDTSIQIITDAMMFITIVVIMFKWDWRLTLISLAVLPLIGGNYAFFIGRMRELWRKLRHKRADISTQLYESVAGAKVVKAFDREHRQKRELFSEMRQTLDWEITVAKQRTAMGRLTNFFQWLGRGIVLWYGGYLVLQGGFTVGQMVAFYQFLGRLYSPIINFIRVNTTIQRAMVAAERVFGLLDSQPTVEEAPDAVPLPEVRGHVKFEGVSFSYEPENPVLDNITFEAEPDMMVALVGPSGSGKTTIANLIARFYDPTEGTISIDGYDLRTVTLKSLRRQMGIVLQDNYLFQGAIVDNLRFGRLNATDEEVVQAALAANAHRFIVEELPEGYQTEVGERGMRLSGGQKQRIAIARTLLRNPRILILDEATSSLDSESEAQIQEALDRLMKGRTTFVIAHRLSTILKADTIVVMEDGRIVEMGTHTQLLEKDGLYANMYHTQFKTDPEALGNE